MDAQSKPHLTPEEYLAIDRHAEVRSEYLGGEMFTISGGSRNHNLIVLNIGRELSLQLKERQCEAYASDQRVRVTATGLYTYPDVVVVCDEPRFEGAELDTLLNPTLVVEVLSPTTEAYDRGKKFEHYQTIPTLSEYLLVSLDSFRAEQYLRQDGNRWLLTTVTGSDGWIVMPSIQCELGLTEVYGKVKLR